MIEYEASNGAGSQDELTSRIVEERRKTSRLESILEAALEGRSVELAVDYGSGKTILLSPSLHERQEEQAIEFERRAENANELLSRCRSERAAMENLMKQIYSSS